MPFGFTQVNLQDFPGSYNRQINYLLGLLARFRSLLGVRPERRAAAMFIRPHCMTGDHHPFQPSRNNMTNPKKQRRVNGQPLCSPPGLPFPPTPNMPPRGLPTWAAPFLFGLCSPAVRWYSQSQPSFHSRSRRENP